MTKPHMALTAYALIALTTFGHAYNNIEVTKPSIAGEQEQRLFGGLGCAVFWPLYWSQWSFAK